MHTNNHINHRANRMRGFTLGILFSVLSAIILIALFITNNIANSGSGQKKPCVVISEIMTDNDSVFPDQNGVYFDWVEIANMGDQPVNMREWGLSDRPDRILFLFPDTVLGAGEHLVVFLSGKNQKYASALHAAFKLSSLGEQLYFLDAKANVVESITIPTLNSNESYMRTEEGLFKKTYKSSPGYPNNENGYAAYQNNYLKNDGVLIINEIMPSPRTGIRDEDGDLSDWIEIYNQSDETVYLSDYMLSDDAEKYSKWRFPNDTILHPGEYYLIFCSGKDKLESNTGYPHTNFSINANNETLILSTSSGRLVDRITIKDIEADFSYGRNNNSQETWSFFSTATPGAPNNLYGQIKTDRYLRDTNYSGIYISEVMASSTAVVAASEEDACDFIEIYNSSALPCDISGWGLSDNVDWPLKWTFPPGTTIYPGEYKIILADGSVAIGTDKNYLHTSFRISRTAPECITLSDANGYVLDKLQLPELPADVSYGRSISSEGFYFFDPPTPGSKNVSGFSGYAKKPILDKPSGLYKGKLSVSVTAPADAVVRYTLDGSTPTLENGAEYYPGCPDFTDFSGTRIIRVRSFEAGKRPSETVTASYIMNTYHTLNVVSLVIDPYELWNPLTGLFTVGENVDKSKGIPYANTVYRDNGKIARPGYVDYMLSDSGTAVLSQGMKIDLMGDYSLDMPQKSMKIRANASTGERYFNYPLFDSRPYSFYKSFTLRNSGNDCVWTRVSDGVQTRLIDRYIDTDIITLAWQPVVVYINGQYWGHFNMRERKDEYCIAQHEDFPIERANEITILRGNSQIVQGSNEEYLQMRERIANSSPNTNQKDRFYLDQHIDIDSYLDWFAIKMFFGDSDPGNFMFYQLPGGKWKCLIFDLDYGMFRSYFDSPKSYMKETGMGDKRINNVIFRKILEVDEYRDLFLKKIGKIYQALTTPLMQNELDLCVAIIEPEMMLHFNRWAQYNDRIINSDSPLTEDGAMRYWKERVRRMRDETMVNRPYWIYTMVQNTFQLSDDKMVYYFGPLCPAVPTD